MYEYEHTQPGTLLRWILMASVIMVAGLGWYGSTREAPAMSLICGSVAAVLVLCLLLFHALTVKISPSEMTIQFGIGWIGKSFVVMEIVSASVVQNRWYYGWGIRLTPHGWLYNVSGLKAVEIHLKNGRSYRIGTDEPNELLAAVNSVLGEAPRATS